MSIYDDELNKMASAPRGGGRRQHFMEWNKPSVVGAATNTRIRIVPRLNWFQGQDGQFHPNPTAPKERFWVRVFEHRIELGEDDFVTLRSPDDLELEGWKTRLTDPILILQQELYKGPKEHHAFAKSLFPKSRAYVNILDIDNPWPQWGEQAADGTYPDAHCSIWGMSKSTLADLLTMCKHKGPIEDPQIGRHLIVEIRRVDSGKMGIRYKVTDLDPSPLDAHAQALAQRAYSLDDYEQASSLDELAEIAARIDPRQLSPAAPAPNMYGNASYGQQQPPAQPNYGQPPGPPAYGQPTQAAPTIWHFMGPMTGQGQGTVQQVLGLIQQNQGQGQVWREGLNGWVDYRQVPDFMGFGAQPAQAAASPVAALPAQPPGPPMQPAGPPAQAQPPSLVMPPTGPGPGHGPPPSAGPQAHPAGPPNGGAPPGYASVGGYGTTAMPAAAPPAQPGYAQPPGPPAGTTPMAAAPPPPPGPPGGPAF